MKCKKVRKMILTPISLSQRLKGDSAHSGSMTLTLIPGVSRPSHRLAPNYLESALNTSED